MITSEQALILRAINDHIHKEKTVLNENVDWSIVYNLCCSHQITAIIFSQCKEFIPKEFFDDFNKKYSLTLYTNLKRKQNDTVLFSKLKKDGIHFFVLKGQEFAKYYPVDVFRTMGDTDIVVDDREKTHTLLVSEKYTNISKALDREWQYYKDGLEYEIHDRLVYSESINTDSITAFLDSYKKYIKDGSLDDSFHFIYAICHLRKHLMNRGIGLRQFIDLGVLVQNNNNLDWIWIEQTLKEMRIFDFSKTVFSLIDSWFSVKTPIIPAVISSEVFDRFTEYIFKNGVFGKDNSDNDKYLASNKVRSEKHSIFQMMINVIKNVFPSYQTLIQSGKYDFLKNRPWLLPLVWLIRLLKNMKDSKIKGQKKRLQNSFVSRNYIDTREKMFIDWGL